MLAGWRFDELIHLYSNNWIYEEYEICYCSREILATVIIDGTRDSVIGALVWEQEKLAQALDWPPVAD